MRSNPTRPVLASLIVGVLVATALAEPPSPPSAEGLKNWGPAPMVIVGTLEGVQAGPVAQSFPPIYNHTLSVKVADVLRGDAKIGDTLRLHHSARQENEPTFPQGKRVLVAVKPTPHGGQVIQLIEADDAAIADARAACSLPVGWFLIGEGQLRSPWASMGDRAWPKDLPDPVGMIRCGATGRPAYLLGSGVAMSVEHVPPAKEIKWTNPDGDGEYRITVTNTTDHAIEVPALRRSGEKILWDECIVLLCQGKTYASPAAMGVGVATEAVKLEPGQSVSHVVNVLALDGPEWPQGGYRIEFTFAIGERAITKSLYYMSRHHDALREKARASLKRGG